MKFIFVITLLKWGKQDRINCTVWQHIMSAKAQASLIQQMLDDAILTEEEENFYRRGRNGKSATSAKNTDIKTYRMSTGFEALMGFLHLTNQTVRLEELIDWCIQQVEKETQRKG